MKRIGDGLESERTDEQLKNGQGYDHIFAVSRRKGELACAAILYDPVSGRQLSVMTDKPGMQLYTGNFLDGSIQGKNGAVYGKRSALCLETQYFPNAVNTRRFASSALKAGARYASTTAYVFAAKA